MVVGLTLVSTEGAGLDAVGRLARLYQGLARRHGLDVEVLDAKGEEKEPVDYEVIEKLVVGLLKK